MGFVDGLEAVSIDAVGSRIQLVELPVDDLLVVDELVLDVGVVVVPVFGGRRICIQEVLFALMACTARGILLIGGAGRRLVLFLGYGSVEDGAAAWGEGAPQINKSGLLTTLTLIQSPHIPLIHSAQLVVLQHSPGNVFHRVVVLVKLFKLEIGRVLNNPIHRLLKKILVARG